MRPPFNALFQWRIGKVHTADGSWRRPDSTWYESPFLATLDPEAVFCGHSHCVAINVCPCTAFKWAGVTLYRPTGPGFDLARRIDAVKEACARSNLNRLGYGVGLHMKKDSWKLNYHDKTGAALTWWLRSRAVLARHVIMDYPSLYRHLAEARDLIGEDVAAWEQDGFIEETYAWRGSNLRWWGTDSSLLAACLNLMVLAGLDGPFPQLPGHSWQEGLRAIRGAYWTLHRLCWPRPASTLVNRGRHLASL